MLDSVVASLGKLRMHKLGRATGPAEPVDVHVRCPLCRQNGVFYGYSKVYDLSWKAETAGSTYTWKACIRICPNSSCRCVVFLVIREDVIVEAYPATTIEFDASRIPSKIRDTLEEAIRCHGAKAYRASAIMVRRMLEELCDDKGVSSKNLHDRLLALGSAIVVPRALIDAAMELKILGNDAAHLISKNYDLIGEAEASIAIDLAKELLKAVYQYDDLLAKLQGLKKSP